MLVSEHSNEALASGFLLLVNLLLESFLSIVLVDGFDHGVVLYLVACLSKSDWLVVLASDSLENCLVDQGARADARLKGRISITDSINMIKLFVEHVMHLVRVVLELVYLENGVSKLDSMLEARARQLLVLDH